MQSLKDTFPAGQEGHTIIARHFQWARMGHTIIARHFQWARMGYTILARHFQWARTRHAVIIIIIDRFYIALSSALERTQCARR